MRKIILPALISLAVSSVAFAQTAPTAVHVDARQSGAPATMPAAHPASNALSEANIKTLIANAGYKEVKGLEFKKGVWRTKARGGNDKWAELAVGPISGKVYKADAPSKLNADEVTAKLSAAGYQHIHDVEFEGGLWSVDASTADGADVDLLVDPDDGSVVANQRD